MSLASCANGHSDDAYGGTYGRGPAYYYGMAPYGPFYDGDWRGNWMHHRTDELARLNDADRTRIETRDSFPRADRMVDPRERGRLRDTERSDLRARPEARDAAPFWWSP